MSWFKRKSKNIQTESSDRKDIQEGLWVKCESCRQIVFQPGWSVGALVIRRGAVAGEYPQHAFIPDTVQMGLWKQTTSGDEQGGHDEN